MFAGFLVVLLVELADKLLENRTHAVVIQSRMLHDGLCIILVDGIRREVDIRGDELLNDCTEDVCVNHGVNLIAELELLQNLLHIGREAVKVCLEVRL